MKITTLNSPLCLLGEGPVWNDKENAIYYLDILNNKIFRKQDDKEKALCIWETDSNIGGIAFYNNGDIVAFVKEGLKRLRVGTEGKVDKEELIVVFDLDIDERYNDIIVDPKGRIFAGTIKSTHKEGKLILFEKGKEPKVVLSGLRISNGMGFSPDEKYFYHTDTKFGEIKRYEYDIDTAAIASPVTIYSAANDDGGPDGMTVDINGDLWTACWGASQIMHISSSGEIFERIKIDANQVSSITFGGTNLDTAYVTSAGIGADDENTFMNKDGSKMGGNTFEILMDVSGKKDYRADV